MLSRFEDRHVRADLSNDITGGGLRDARDVRGQLDQLVIGFGEFYDGIIQSANDGREVVGMLSAEIHLNSLVIGDFVTNDGGDNIIRFILRNCRKISDADCAVYFFEDVCQKT